MYIKLTHVYHTLTMSYAGVTPSITTMVSGSSRTHLSTRSLKMTHQWWPWGSPPSPHRGKLLQTTINYSNTQDSRGLNPQPTLMHKKLLFSHSKPKHFFYLSPSPTAYYHIAKWQDQRKIRYSSQWHTFDVRPPSLPPVLIYTCIPYNGNVVAKLSLHPRVFQKAQSLT